jgi:hypothetical protein
MKYKYYGVSPQNTQLKTIKRPMVMVEIFGNKRTKKMLALIDSGWDTLRHHPCAGWV